MKLHCTELAWQAGIMDGEGCITLAKQLRKGRPSPAFRPTVTVTNTDPAICQPFVAAWGGKLYERPDKRVVKKWALSFTWYCPRSSVWSFLSYIRPYLVSKRKQADLLIDFVARCREFPRYKGSTSGSARGGSKPLGSAEIKYRERIWNEIRKLNTKGQFSRKGGIPTASIE